MRVLLALLLHTLLAAVLLAAGPVRAQALDHAESHTVLTMAVAHDASPAVTHMDCDTHRSPADAMAAHGNSPRCKQACLALSAGFSAVLPVQAHALRLADGPTERPETHHTVPTGRVVMPERRPPRTA